MQLSWSLILLLTVWVVLPMLPAVFISWLFNRGDVSVDGGGPGGGGANGPFGKFKFKASGPFAAYIVVFVGIAAYVWLTRSDINDSSRNQYWTVEIPIEFEDWKGRKMPMRDVSSYLETLDVEFQPRPHILPGASKVTLRIVPQADDQLPFIKLKSKKIRDEPIDISEFQARNTGTKHMLTKKITIRVLPQEIPPSQSAVVTADEQTAN